MNKKGSLTYHKKRLRKSLDNQSDDLYYKRSQIQEDNIVSILDDVRDCQGCLQM